MQYPVGTRRLADDLTRMHLQWFGGSKPPVYASGNIDNATRSLGNTVNTPVSGWNKTNDFIVALALEAVSGGKIANTNIRIEWQNKTDGSGWNTLSGSGELVFGATDLVEGNSLDSGEAICTPVNGTTYVAGSPSGGVEKETSATFTVGDDATADQWSEFQISVSGSANGHAGDEYEFRCYDVDNSVVLGPSAATITFAGGGTAYQRSTADAIGITDAITGAVGKLVALADGVGVTDALSAARSLVVTVVDSVGVTDVLTKIGTFLRTAADSVGLTDAVATVRNLVVDLADTVGLTDTLTTLTLKVAELSDGVGVTDDITTTAQYVVALSDTVGLTDLVSRIGTWIRSLADQVGFTDSNVESVGYRRVVGSTIGVTDALATTVTKIVLLADAVGVTDVLTRVGHFVTTLAETVGIIDLISATKNPGVGAFFAFIADTVGVTDTLTKIGTFIRSASDAVGITDVFSRIGAYIRSIADMIGLTDVLPTSRHKEIGVASGKIIPDGAASSGMTPNTTKGATMTEDSVKESGI